MKQIHALVLAAGKGTRMKSRRPKVLHELCGTTMLAHVAQTLQNHGVGDIRVVVNPELREPVEALGLHPVLQEQQLGTGHAVQTALADLPADKLPVLIVSADMPLIPGELLERVCEAQAAADAALALVTAMVPPSWTFGRIVREEGKVTAIVEVRDAPPEPPATIPEVNAGIYCFNQAKLRHAVAGLTKNNAQGEFYLTDCVAVLAGKSELIETIQAKNLADIIGVNTLVELSRARAILQSRILERHMLAGVTITDPESTYIDWAVTIEPDATIHPQTHLAGRTSIASGCTIGPNTYISNSTIAQAVEIVQSVVKDSAVGEGATIGPFAHLRNSTIVESGAHIGNFVETKNSRLGRGAKASHLSYLGDADVGDKANIGAGTITCNYDGKKKNKTNIGKGAFIGSNSSLVAPVSVGDNALTGAGSVVLHDVPEGERVAGNPAKPLSKKQTLEPT